MKSITFKSEYFNVVIAQLTALESKSGIEIMSVNTIIDREKSDSMYYTMQVLYYNNNTPKPLLSYNEEELLRVIKSFDDKTIRVAFAAQPGTKAYTDLLTCVKLHGKGYLIAGKETDSHQYYTLA